MVKKIPLSRRVGYVMDGSMEDVTKTRNGERGTENGERGTGNGERGTGNEERETGNGKRKTENGERGTGVWERVYSENPPSNSTWRTKERKREQFGEM